MMHIGYNLHEQILVYNQLTLDYKPSQKTFECLNWIRDKIGM